MEATANVSVATASSSSSADNSSTINVPIPPSIWVGKTNMGPSSKTSFSPNRPISSTPVASTAQLNSPKTPEIANTVIEVKSTSGFILPSRIHRNSGDQIPQSPPNTQFIQNMQFPQNSPHQQSIQYPQIAQHSQIQYPQNAQSLMQYSQNVLNIQNLTHVQMQNPQNIQNVPHMQVLQNPQNMLRTQNVQSSQIAQSASNIKFPSNKQIGNQQQMQNPQSAQQNAQNRKNPRNTQNTRNKQNPGNAENRSTTETRNTDTPEDDESVPESPRKRVVVTGYPNYTQAHDILEVFTKFGSVRIDRCSSVSTTLTYASEEQARKAMDASKRLHIYGHFLSVKPCVGKSKPDEPRSPKREFLKSKQKGMIIEPSKIDMSGTFHVQLDRILATIRLNQDDINRISTLYRDLEITFQNQWPGCKAIPFGSITTGLGIKTSDADCFINLPVQFRHPSGNHVARARRLLAQQPHIFAEILAIPRANTPIVKFYHVPTDINCDLTFKTPLGAQNSRLITFLMQVDPRITPVAVIIKYWAKVHDLSGTGKLTNYALTMLIIFYLQQPPISILPPIEWLQKDRSNDVFVDYWNTGFNSKFLPPITNTSSIAELLGGFFEYYSLFNFEDMIVCPFLGVPLKKEIFRDLSNIPPEFELYKKNVINGFVLPMRCQTSFCVQDPFEQCHNVASTITTKLALDIKTYFKFVANIYEKEKLRNCKEFLKNMLLEKPKLVRGKSHLEYRVPLFPKTINTIVNFDWKAVIREVVMTMFENMMKIKLGKVEEKVNPDTKKEKEKFIGRIAKPIWRRKKFGIESKIPRDLGIVEKQSLITEELIKREVKSISLQVQLIMTFCHDPKSAVVVIRMGGGDLDAFRDFGKFFITVMQSWFGEMLKPYSVPKCTADKIAEAKESELKELESDSDDENDNELSSLPSSEDNKPEDKTNGCDDAITNEADANTP